MANVLTALAADMYKAADTVGRELVGLIPSVMVNAKSEQAAVGQSVRSHFTRSVAAGDIAPSMTIPEGTDQTVDNKTLTLTKQRGVAIPWTGEDIKYVNAGAGYETIYGDQIKQAMRTLANEAEADLWLECKNNASRAQGASGTNPFATNFNAVAEGRQILVDNGCDVNQRNLSLVINSLAGTKLRNQAQLQKANEAGSTELLRNGMLLDLQGVMLKESAAIGTTTAGTAAGATTTAATLTVGQTVLPLATAGTGLFVKGDVITIANDTLNQYVVTAVSMAGANPASGDTITIGGNGIRMAQASAARAITVTAAYTGNILLAQNAAEIAFRAPASPAGGDAASDVMIVQDPYSGLVFEVSAYKGFKKAMIYVAAVWGVKAWKGDNIVIVKG